MNIRQILDSNFPEKGTLPASTISTEGFADTFKKLFKRKKDGGTKGGKKVPPQPLSHFQWVQQYLVDGDPKELTFKDTDTVVIGPQAAPNFVRSNGRPIKDVTAEFRRDLNVYKRLFEQYKGIIETNLKASDKINSEAEAFNKRYTPPEGIDEFAKLLSKWQGYIKQSARDAFREPNKDFLAYGKQPFGNDVSFTATPKRLKQESIELPTVTSKDVEELFKLFQEITVLEEQVFVMANSSRDSLVDDSEMPFRYYLEHAEEKAGITGVLKFEEYAITAQNLDLIYNLDQRIGWLSQALVTYIRESTR